MEKLGSDRRRGAGCRVVMWKALYLPRWGMLVGARRPSVEDSDEWLQSCLSMTASAALKEISPRGPPVVLSVAD